MNHSKRHFIFWAVGLFIFGLASSSGAAKKASAVLVIVKAGGPLEGLTLKDIRAVYLGEKLFQGSGKIEPLMNGDESIAAVFFGKILGKTKAQYKKVWKSKAFVDGLVAPTVLPGSGDVLQSVKADDSTIGFVNEGDIPPGEMKSVKVLYSSK